MTKRELKAEIEIRVRTEVFEASIAALQARVAELGLQVESMRRDIRRTGERTVMPFDQLTGDPLSEGQIEAGRQLAEVRRGAPR